MPDSAVGARWVELVGDGEGSTSMLFPPSNLSKVSKERLSPSGHLPGSRWRPWARVAPHRQSDRHATIPWPTPALHRPRWSPWRPGRFAPCNHALRFEWSAFPSTRLPPSFPAVVAPAEQCGGSHPGKGGSSDPTAMTRKPSPTFKRAALCDSRPVTAPPRTALEKGCGVLSPLDVPPMHRTRGGSALLPLIQSPFKGAHSREMDEPNRGVRETGVSNASTSPESSGHSLTTTLRASA